MIADPREQAPAVANEAPSPAEKPSPEPAEEVALDVVWCDPACADAIAEDDALRASASASAAPQQESAADPSDPWAWPDDSAEEDEPEEQAGDVVVMGALRRGRRTPLADLESKLMKALRAGRNLKAPIALVQGELRLRFDPKAELEVHADAARPLGRRDKKLAATIDHVDDLMTTSLSSVPDVARGQTARLIEQWHAANRDLPKSFLQDSARALLLDKRAFEMRDVLDDEHLRASLVGNEGAVRADVPLYVPAAASKRLPLMTAFAVRCLVRLMPRQDERETHPAALVVLALARVVSL